MYEAHLWGVERDDADALIACARIRKAVKDFRDDGISLRRIRIEILLARQPAERCDGDTGPVFV